MAGLARDAFAVETSDSESSQAGGSLQVRRPEILRSLSASFAMLVGILHPRQASKYPTVVSVMSKRAREEMEESEAAEAAEEPARVSRFPGGGFKARMAARARWEWAWWPDSLNQSKLGNKSILDCFP